MKAEENYLLLQSSNVKALSIPHVKAEWNCYAEKKSDQCESFITEFLWQRKPPSWITSDAQVFE